MPAITVDDITVLPRIPEPDPTVADLRRVRSITNAPSGFEGEGFPVRRAFAGVALEDLDPFIHLDQMGEVEYAPGEPKGTPWHPHRGFETVTYMIDGTFEHSDSNGGGGVITNGDTQWMTAGGGHPPHRASARSPRPERRPVPRVPALGEPAGRPEVGCAALPGHPGVGGRPRLIAGRRDARAGDRGRGRRSRGSGIDLQPDDARPRDVEPGARLALPWRVDDNALLYVMAGQGTAGPDGHPVRTGSSWCSVRERGDGVGGSRSRSRAARTSSVLILGGRPIREPVAWLGPFVMNTREEVMQAVVDYQAGRLGTIPAVHGAPTTLIERRTPPTTG